MPKGMQERQADSEDGSMESIWVRAYALQHPQTQTHIHTETSIWLSLSFIWYMYILFCSSSTRLDIIVINHQMQQSNLSWYICCILLEPWLSWTEADMHVCIYAVINVYRISNTCILYVSYAYTIFCFIRPWALFKLDMHYQVELKFGYAWLDFCASSTWSKTQFNVI